jgi:coproporphyrinogen dehydrogenase HemZ
MIKVLLKGHDFKYEVSELLKVFIHSEEIQFIEEEALAEDQSFLLINHFCQNKNDFMAESVLLQSHHVILKKVMHYPIEDIQEDSKLEVRKIQKRMIKLTIYDVLSAFYNKVPSWGILTGIRPTKIVHEFMDQGLDFETIREKLKEQYRICDEKINLLLEVAQVERKIILRNHNDWISLYISIPFCPTRCLYCSFPSNPLGNDRSQIEKYLNALFYEIEAIGKRLDQMGKKVQTLYIGGGTPTTLTVSELKELMTKIKEHINLKWVEEITVEAGRPDTVTFDKLMVLKENGVHRISINPQTMHQKTLEVIGRFHTPQDIVNAYQLAKKIGFHTINMDLIIGLPGETPEDVADTMKQIIQLDPENITVHTLAIKKTSQLRQNIQKYVLAREKEVKRMLEITRCFAGKIDLNPYYMYRQKHMLGNLENTGYSKIGHECIYNIQMIEERQSIIALGAGAVSKMVYLKENRLERLPNVTNVDQYITRIQEMIDRKEKELEKYIDI